MMSFEFVFFLFRFFLFFYPSFVVYLSSSLFSFSLLRVVCFLFRPRSCYALLCLLDVHPLHTTIGFVPSCSLLSCVLYYSIGVIIILWQSTSFHVYSAL